MNARDFTRQRSLINRQYESKRQRRKAMAGLLKRSGAALVVISARHVGFRLRTGEIVCVKDRFKNERQALLAMGRIQEAELDGVRVPKRAYQCQRCLGWHLTSQDKNEVH